MKQETLEEASEYFAHNNFNMHDTNNYKALKVAFEQGAKYQQERSYSEEEVIKLLEKRDKDVGNWLPPIKWFEQFKKE